MTALSQAAHRAGLDALDGALQTALDTDLMSGHLAAFLGAGGEHGVRTARLVTRVPGKRAVVVLETDAGTVLIAKVYADADRAGRLHSVLQQLHALAEAGRECKVPRPVVLVPGLGMVVHEAVHGRSLDCLDGDQRLDAVMSAARWLASLHSSGIALERSLDMTSEVRKIHASADVVSRHDRAVGTTAARLARRLALLASQIEVAGTVPVHEDFHYQHVLIDGGRAVVIDLDEMRAGDAAFDVAHFLANLRLLALRERTASRHAARLESAFLNTYASRIAYELDAGHEFFYGYTCLKIARQLVTGRGPTPVPVGAELDRQLGLIIEEGLSCPLQ